MYFFIFFLHFIITLGNTQSESVPKLIKRGAVDFSFSYAATDVDSKDGTHVKTLTLIKNSGKEQWPKSEKEFKDIAELVKLFSLNNKKGKEEHEKKEEKEENEKEKKPEAEVIKEVTEIVIEEDNKEPEKDAELINDSKMEKQKIIKPYKMNKTLESYEEDFDSFNKESLKEKQEISPYLAPFLNGKLVFYVPNTKKDVISQKNENIQNKRTSLYSPENIITKSNHNKILNTSSLSSRKIIDYGFLNATTESIFLGKRKLPYVFGENSHPIIPRKRPLWLQ